MKLIPLTQGFFAMVDDADYEVFAASRWYAHRDGRTIYARRHVVTGGKRVRLLMHRVILDAPCALQVDHINGNGLDNRRSNLRLATSSQNKVNRSFKNNIGYRGIYQKNTRFEAAIRVLGSKYYLGSFASPEAAAHAYDAAARKYHGEFARLNFPEASQQ